MIAPLRRAHRRVFAVLGMALPLAYGAGLLARPPRPVSSWAGDRTGGAPEDGGAHESHSATLVPGGQCLRLASWREGARRVVELAPELDLQLPDVLVYAFPRERFGEAAVSADALAEGFLLGALGGVERRRFEVPPELGSERVTLVLYSLAHHEVVGALQVH